MIAITPVPLATLVAARAALPACKEISSALLIQILQAHNGLDNYRMRMHSLIYKERNPASAMNFDVASRIRLGVPFGKFMATHRSRHLQRSLLVNFINHRTTHQSSPPLAPTSG